MTRWYLGGLIDHADSRDLQAEFQSYVQMFSCLAFLEHKEASPSCCFTACNHNKSMPAAHINIAPKSTAKLKGGEWIWDPFPLTRVRGMHAERAVEDPTAGHEHSWSHLSTCQIWKGKTEVFGEWRHSLYEPCMSFCLTQHPILKAKKKTLIIFSQTKLPLFAEPKDVSRNSKRCLLESSIQRPCVLKIRQTLSSSMYAKSHDKKKLQVQKHKCKFFKNCEDLG